MKKLIVILTILLLCSCSMSNDEVITEVNKCKAAGFKPQPVTNTWTYGIIVVRCYPIEDTK